MWLPAYAVPARVAADAWTRHAAARLGASIVAAAGLVAWPSAMTTVAGWTGATCLIHAVAGVPCPGCGITTSLLALGRGDLAAAWTANPGGFAAAGVLVGQAVVAVWALCGTGAGSAGAPPADSGARWFSWLDRSLVAGLLTAWATRLMWAVS